MITALVLSIGLAAGHHAFYESLRGTQLSSEPFKFAGLQASQQQFSTTVGTAFAFLFKASVVLAASAAYMQLFFRTLHSGSYSIGTLDNWYSSLSDISCFFCASTYYRHWALAFVALTTWLLPLAAIFPPASLSVAFDKLEPSPVDLKHVPQPAFDSLAFHDINEPSTIGNGTLLSTRGPKEEVSRIVNAVAAAGSILPISPPGVNTSWTVSFEAPILSCKDVNNEFRDAVKANTLKAMKGATADAQGLNGTLVTMGSSTATAPVVSTRSGGAMTTIATAGEVVPLLASYGNVSNSRSMVSYMGWLGWYGLTSIEDRLPFYGNSSNVRFRSEGDLRQSRYAVDDLYLAVFPRAASSEVPDVWRGKLYFDSAIMDWYFEDATLIECTLGAANYTLQFTYSGQDQQQHIEVLSAEEVPLPSQTITGAQLSFSDTGQINVIGYGPQNHWPNGRLSLRQWSFLELWRATVPLFLGATNAIGGNGLADLGGEVYQTKLFSTSLLNAREFSAWSSDQPSVSEITNTTSGKTFDQATSLLSPASQPGSGRALQEAIEELFFNITISMASSKILQYNDSSPMAPPKVNVTSTLYGNVYSYSYQKLWLAYGIAILIGIVDVCLGIWAILETGASSSAKFSTVVRIAKNAEIDTQTHEDTLPGRDPLPKHIRGAKLSIRTSSSVELRSLGQARYRQIDQSQDEMTGSETRLAA
ncbi:hypothetical protein HII31_00370 [Pseudocercospora fuligena]|uniref:Uncharacterized protein n=1 Tax=Pseudocercospora fuligena TaxID=685502 RepID=A0A8H6RUG7_9PEZI|nr:hypothetical protein HII31_00370 [Pseudocercospora fuligena]